MGTYDNQIGMIKNRSVKTYNSRQVFIACGEEAISGLADDTFVTLEQKGNGVISKSGVDGEVARAIDPNEQYTIRFVLLQTGTSNAFLQEQYVKDMRYGNGIFPILIKDMTGQTVFSADAAWVSKQPTRTYGKDTVNREWTLETGPAKTNFLQYKANVNRDGSINPENIYNGSNTVWG